MNLILQSLIGEHLSGCLFSEQELYEKVQAYAQKNQLLQTLQALPYASQKHRGQFRKGEEKIPYYVHPLSLAYHAILLGRGTDEILAACLLHDVCEDCGVRPDELPVGDEIKTAVSLLTKADDFAHGQEENAAYYCAIAENRIAALVKLLDRCNNVSGMAAAFSDEKLAKYIIETREYTLPLLERAVQEYPEDQEVYYLLRYHIESVLMSLQFMLKRRYE